MGLLGTIKDIFKRLDPPNNLKELRESIRDIRGDLRSLFKFTISSIIAILLAIFAGFYFMHYSLQDSFETRFSSIENSQLQTTSRIDNLFEHFLKNKDFESEADGSSDVREKSKNPGYHARIYLFLEGYSKKKDLYELTELKEFENAACASWSPVTTEMVFLSLTGQSKIQGKICIYNYKTKSIEVLTETGNENLDPKFSPDGQKIVYTGRNPKKRNRWDIFIFNRASKEVKKLTFESEREKYRIGDRNRYPSFSPDGEWITFCSDYKGEGFSLFIMSKIGRHKHNICILGDVCKNSFSPDGKWFVLETEDGRSLHDIWIAPVKDGRLIMSESELDPSEYEIEKLEKIGNYYFRRLTDSKKGKNNTAHIDPVWLNDDEVMYLFTDEIGKRKEFLASDVNWTIRKINIHTGIIIELPLAKAKYRCPQPKIVF